MPDAGLTAPEIVADSLRRRIVEGFMRPGTRVREEEIAADHGVSRVPVREALRRLEAEGYVDLTPHQGARVAVPSRTAALELMEVRRALEVLAARLAAASRGGGLAQQLEGVTREGRDSVDRSDRSGHPGLVDDFHELVARGSGNRMLAELLGQLRTKVRWVFAMDVEERGPVAWDDHEAVLGAILAGDVEKAGALMDEHVLRDERWFESHVDHLTSSAD